MKDTKADFPEEGNEGVLYIEITTGAMYTWNPEFDQYVEFSKGGGSIEISKAEGNIIKLNADGLYVPSAPVQVSKEEGNLTSMKTDGIYTSVEFETENIDFSNF